MKDVKVMAALVYILLFILVTLVLYAYLVWFSRWSNGWSHAHRPAIWGPVEPLVMTARALLQRPQVPPEVIRTPYLVGPAVSVVASMAALFLLPWRPGAPFFLGWSVPLTTVLGLCGASLFGSVMDGWASSQEPERRSSYTVAARGWLFLLIALLTLSAPALVLVNSWDPHVLVASQWLTWPFVLLQPLGAFVFAVSMLLASPRLPQDMMRRRHWMLTDFDLQHGDSIGALYHLSEHVHVMVASLCISLVYLGGWLGPGGNAIPWALIKALGVALLLEWARPRLLQRHAARTPWAIYLLLAVLNLGLIIVLARWTLPF
jgi:NADH-quinone oxidoreductase subunit H